MTSNRSKVIVPLLLWLLPIASKASLAEKASQAKPWDAFTSKDYPAYLNNIATELSGTPEQLKQKFAQVVAVAIALEKTKGWEGATGKQTRELLQGSKDALRYLDAMKMLLQGDTKGLPKFFDGDPPNYSQWGAAIPVLREHGLELAANVFATVYMTGTETGFPAMNPKPLEEGVVAWVSIPKDKRGPVDAIMATRFDKDWYRAQQVAQTAMRLFLRPPPTMKLQPPTADPRELFELALRVGKDLGILSFDNATDLRQFGKKEEAKMMLRTLAEQNSQDAFTQNRVAQALWFEMGDSDGATAIYQKALQTVPEPNVREVQLQYLKFLKWQKKTDELTAIQQNTSSKDQLLVADALLIGGKWGEAATIYQSQIANRQSEIENQFAAWAGLLDSDPAAALKEGSSLFDEIPKSRIRNRQSAIIWLGRQLWYAVAVEFSPLPGRARETYRDYAKPLHEAPDWEKQCAALMDKLLALDPIACLRRDPTSKLESLRFPAAVMFALSGQQDADSRVRKAQEILKRPIQWQVDPPPGGWKALPGTPPPPDADKPRTFTSPNEDELERLPIQLIETVSRSPNAVSLTPPLAGAMSGELVAKMQGAKNVNQTSSLLKQLSAILYQTVSVLDPLPKSLRTSEAPPPPREVDRTLFAPIDAAVREALKNDAVARVGGFLRREGLLKSMQTASNPKLLEALLDLMLVSLDRYIEVYKDSKLLATEVDYMAQQLEQRRDCDLKPYAAKLRERYSKAQ